MNRDYPMSTHDPLLCCPSLSPFYLPCQNSFLSSLYSIPPPLSPQCPFKSHVRCSHWRAIQSSQQATPSSQGMIPSRLFSLPFFPTPTLTLPQLKHALWYLVPIKVACTMRSPVRKPCLQLVQATSAGGASAPLSPSAWIHVARMPMPRERWRSLLTSSNSPRSSLLMAPHMED